MKEIGIELLNIIDNYGYEAYIVGGFVRDSLMGISSFDIDVTTNATPMELKNIFPNIEVPKKNYGSVTLYYKNIRFEITTYRVEEDYLDNRHPNVIKYVNDLKTDLLRRDFTINTICIDKDGNVVDLLNGQEDLKKHEIKTIGDSISSFNNDSLRILRAIRFATTLNFKMSREIIMAIKETKNLLTNLSYTRKKYELDRIFTSSNVLNGIKLLKKEDLLNVLEIENIDQVKDYSDLLSIWSMINTKAPYPFTLSEKELIEKINIVYHMDNLDNHVLYRYGLYVNVIAGLNKGIDKKLIVEKFNKLPIETRSDINISAREISILLNKKPGKFINDVYSKLEIELLDKRIKNDKEDIIKYIRNNF